MSEINKMDVISYLNEIIEPSSKKDLISLGAVKDIKISGTKINLLIELPTTAQHIKDKIKNEIVELLHNKISNDIEVKIDMAVKDANQGAQKSNQILDGVKCTIAVASGKGGVGKSTVAVNLAVELANQGFKVGLIDADIYGPSIPLMLGINQKPKVTQDESGTRITPLEHLGVKLMSIGFLIDDENPVIWRGPMASGAIKQFLTDVDWGELDYLLFDMPPGTGDVQLTLVQTVPLTGSIIVTTPQDVSLIDARKGLKMFNRVNVPVFGIVENMSYFVAPDTGNTYDIFGAGGGEKLAKELDTNYLGGIPIEPKVREGGDTGNPIVKAHPDSESAKMFSIIAKNLTERTIGLDSGSGSGKVEIIMSDN
jgi:ATP-binding protein involved in chromosome partitioning